MPFVLPVGDAAGIFFVILAIILLAHFLTERMRLPSLVGLVAAGALVGPAGLGIVASGPVVSQLGQLGLIYAFFLLGADADLARLKRTRGIHAGYGLMLSVLPFLLAVAALVLLLGLPLPQALFLGLAIASQSLLPAPALQKLGLGKSRSLLAAEGATSLTEALRAAALIVAAYGLGPGRTGLSWLAGLGILALAVLALGILLPWLAALFFKRAKANDTVEFVFVLALAFLCAWGAKQAGLEAFAGAFIAGNLLGRFFPERSSLEKRLRFVGEWLFVPFFLIAAGTSLDFRSVAADWRALAMAAVLVAAVIVGKLVPALVLRATAGFRADEAGLAFGLTVSQSVPAMAAAGAAFAFGGLDDSGLAAVVLASLITCATGALASRRAGARLALAESQSAGQAAEAPERILVGLSNPARLNNLMDLAFMLRRRGSLEPVVPLSILPESEDNETELSAAESLLAKAIVRGNEAGVPIAPVTAVSVSVAEGIRNAARERSASAIVVGWSKAPKFSRALFGSVIEQVLAGCPELVVVAHIAKPARDITRLILVLPPLVERHPGYARGLQAISTLLSRTGAHLSIYAQKPNGQAAREAASRLRARGQIQVSELENWKDVGQAARIASGSNSAFALFCVRPGGPAWHPAVEKLPHILEEDFPGSPILLFYLPEAGAEAATAAAEREAGPADLFTAALEAGRVIPAMEETAVMDGVKELLRRAFGENRKVLGRLSAQFTEIAQKAPIELEPGIVLLHAHVPEVEEPVVFFGARPEGFRILALDSPARVLVVLCSPESLPPEAHLATLGEIARLFKDRALADRLLAAKSASELGGGTEQIRDEDLE
jgi:Kef-type K+ transport system membrane component KefB